MCIAPPLSFSFSLVITYNSSNLVQLGVLMNKEVKHESPLPIGVSVRGDTLGSAECSGDQRGHFGQ